MASGRKKRDISTLEGNLKETHLVQKSRPLFSIWNSEFSLAEFKLLDVYLSRIDSHHPEQRCITFEKGDIEKVLGVDRIKPNDLKKKIRTLHTTVVSLGDGEQIDEISLFERSQARRDENGIWTASLTCTPSAMKYIFNIERLGYLRYKIKSVMNITSLYSYIMFTYLEYNRFRKSWEVSLEELRKILNCNSESYNQFKIFNNRILKKSHKELTEKTDLQFTYEALKRGRKVDKIRFTVETIADLIPEIKDPTTDKFEDGNDYIIQNMNLLSDACNNEFTKEEMEVIFFTISTSPLPSIHDNIWLTRYHYLAKKYAEMNLQAKRHIINNRFSYFRQMLENDLAL